MEGVMHLLAHGGRLPRYELPTGEKTISPRRKGVKQGGLLMLMGAIVVPLFGVMSSFAPGRLENVFAFFAAISAIICFVGGPLRMLYAGIFEEGAKPQAYVAAPSYTPPAVPLAAARVSALPPPAASTQPWRQHPQTAEIVAPPSVTDHTTKLLEKSDSEKE